MKKRPKSDHLSSGKAQNRGQSGSKGGSKPRIFPDFPRKKVGDWCKN